MDGKRPGVLEAWWEGVPQQGLSTLESTWRAYREARNHGRPPLEAAVCVATRVDRLGLAFAVGYPAALQHLAPSVEMPCALCVTEAGGGHPRAIETRLVDSSTAPNGGQRLVGDKTFVTFGTHAHTLLVAARRGEKPDGRPDLALVRIPADAAGVEIAELPATPFAPEVPHARLTLRDVVVRDDDILPGDGYLDYVKPFRTVEDIHVLAAALAYLGGVVRRARAERRSASGANRTASGELAAEIGSLLVTLGGLSQAPPLDPAVHVALQGVLQHVTRIGSGSALADVWAVAPPEERSRWQRDRALLHVAAKARAARFAKAVEQLDGGDGVA